MGVDIDFKFDKNNNEYKSIIQDYIKRFKVDEMINKNGERYFELKYPFVTNLDTKYLGLQFGFFALHYEHFASLGNYISNCTGKENFIKLKNKTEEQLKIVKKLYEKNKNSKKINKNTTRLFSEDYKSLILILKAILEFTKTGINYPRLILHYD